MKSVNNFRVESALTIASALAFSPFAYADMDAGGFKKFDRSVSVISFDMDAGGVAAITDDIDAGGVAAISFDMDAGGVAAISLDIDAGGFRSVAAAGSCLSAITDDIDAGGLSAITDDIDAGGVAAISFDMDAGGYKQKRPRTVSDMDAGGYKQKRSRSVSEIDAGGVAAISLDMDAGGLAAITDDIDAGGLSAISLDIDAGGLAAISLDMDAGGVARASVNCGSLGPSMMSGVVQHVLSGPVSSIDASKGVVYSLGQAIDVSSSVLSQVSVGDYVAVFGTVTAPGMLYADTVNRFPGQYVPGASKVFVAGIPSNVDRRTGRLSIGDLDVDYNATLGVRDHPDSGLTFIRGTQPSLGGIVLVE